MDRYSRNTNALSEAENLSLRDRRVCVVGCGGLGGNLLEMLGRLGVGQITAVDGDAFDVSNLNRQILSVPGNLGQGKALAARERLLLINPEIKVKVHTEFMTADNASAVLAGHDLVFDALDRIPARLLLEDQAETLGIPLVHGAVAGWYGQVTVVLPGDRTLRRLYPAGRERGVELETGNPAFGPTCVSAIQMAEAVKLLIGRPVALRHKLLVINLLDQEYSTIDLK